jgi:hypothetical protein
MGFGLQQSPGTSNTTVETLLEAIAGLVTQPFDYVVVVTKNAAGDPTQVVYKSGGAGGVTVATLNITYDVDGDFQSVTST